MTFLPSVLSASVCFTACNSSPSIRSKALHHVPGTTVTDALTTGAADLFRNPPGKFAHIRIKAPAASNGGFDPRGSRQISMQAWLLGSLLAGIKKIMPFCFHFNTYFHWIHLFILPSLRKFSVLPYPPPAGKTGLILPCFPALLFP